MSFMTALLPTFDLGPAEREGAYGLAIVAAEPASVISSVLDDFEVPGVDADGEQQRLDADPADDDATGLACEADEEPIAAPHILGHAHRYADLGIPVLPLKPGCKEPRQCGWTRKATTSRDRISNWPPQWAHGNLGCLAGRGLLVIDVDPRNGGTDSLRGITNRGKLPTTAHARTGGGGSHYLFRVDRRKYDVKTKKAWRPGIDMLGTGAYFVVEPSVHPDTGKEYVWLRSPEQGIADAPEWLVAMLLKDGVLTKKRSAKRQRGAHEPAAQKAPRTAPGRPIPEHASEAEDEVEWLTSDAIGRVVLTDTGQRWDAAHRLICRLHCQGHGAETITAVTMGWWEHYYRRGFIDTDQQTMAAWVAQCIRSTQRNAKLVAPTGQHAKARSEIQLTDVQRAAIDHRKRPANAQAKTLDRDPHRCAPDQILVRGGGPIRDRLSDPLRIAPCGLPEKLCSTPAESVVVEALLVMVRYKRECDPDPALLWTHDQIAETIQGRTGEVWSKDRVKDYLFRYVSRPGQPAKVFELLRRVETGSRKQGQSAGTPSRFVATGIEQLLALTDTPDSETASPFDAPEDWEDSPWTTISMPSIAPPISASSSATRTAEPMLAA